MNIFRLEQIRTIEQNAVQYGLSCLRLMENAGSAAARLIRETYGRHETSEGVSAFGQKVVVLCGRGNNGGDGYVAARKLFEAGAQVHIVMAEGVPRSENAMEMFGRTQTLSIPTLDFRSDPEHAYLVLRGADLIIDAVYGTGFSGELSPAVQELFRYAAGAPGQVVALDVPSGTVCDTGEAAVGALCADLTVSFIALKPCHIIPPASGLCGRTAAVEIGIAPEAFDGVPAAFEGIEPESVRPFFGPRPADCHKGDFGRALLICGSRGMAGAAALAGEAAVRCGVGLATLAVPESVYAPLAARLAEPVFALLPETGEGTLSAQAAEPLAERLERADACLIGCGMGLNADTQAVTEQVVRTARCPLVIDADGINALARHIDVLNEKTAPVILTPHPGEMARLCGTDVAEVQANRMACARELALRYGVTVVLKGAHTVVASPEGELSVNFTGNGGMAGAGFGDALAGMLVSLLAQGMSARDAARSAVCLHGAAGDRAAARRSQRALTPVDLIGTLPELFCEFEQIG